MQTVYYFQMLQKHDSVLPNIELISKGNAHGLLLMTLADVEPFGASLQMFVS